MRKTISRLKEKLSRDPLPFMMTSKTEITDELTFLPNFKDMADVVCSDYNKVVSWKLTHKQNIVRLLRPRLNQMFTNLVDIIAHQTQLRNVRQLLQVDRRANDIAMQYFRSITLTKTHEQNIKAFLHPLILTNLEQIRLELKLVLMEEGKKKGESGKEEKKKEDSPLSLDIEGIFDEFVANYKPEKLIVSPPSPSSASSSSPPPSSTSAASISSPSSELSSPSSVGIHSLTISPSKAERDPYFTKWVASLKAALIDAEAKATKARREDELKRDKEREELEKKKHEDLMEKEVEDKLCVVCMEHSKVVCLSPCGHIATCERCCEGLEKCPLCQGDVTSRQRAYF